jgi:hypothetical protein
MGLPAQLDLGSWLQMPMLQMPMLQMPMLQMPTLILVVVRLVVQDGAVLPHPIYGLMSL